MGSDSFQNINKWKNADLRLTEKSFRLGLASEERMQIMSKKKAEVDDIKKIAATLPLESDDINDVLDEVFSAKIIEKQKLEKILLRPNVQLKDILRKSSKVREALSGFSTDGLEQAEIQIKYQVYIDKEGELVKRMSQMENLSIPSHFDYTKLQALSAEAKEKLIKVRPQTLGQASRISGINPSDVQVLLVYMGR
jgi:tRNA uridine 5-carboxymethylaminomethyl modification enzyme